MREPRVYKINPVAGQSTTAKRDVSESPNQALNANYGRRWMQFQQGLRQHRDKVVSGCGYAERRKRWHSRPDKHNESRGLRTLTFVISAAFLSDECAMNTSSVRAEPIALSLFGGPDE